VSRGVFSDQHAHKSDRRAVSEINWRDARLPNPNTILIHCDSASVLKAGELLPRVQKAPAAHAYPYLVCKSNSRALPDVMEIESEEQDLYLSFRSQPLSVPARHTRKEIELLNCG